MPPNLNEEKKLWKKGFKKVACLDEVGRGALCGPVVAAAAVIVIKKSPFQKLWKSDFHNIKDSKKLTPKKREEFYKLLRNHPAIKWGLGRASEKIIDKINILEATKLAMERAVKNLNRKLGLRNKKIDSVRKSGLSNGVDFLILDGKIKLDAPLPQKAIVKADEKVVSCALASIVAKVSRDRIMVGCHKIYPKYGFDWHKGYPTKRHLKMLKKYGPSVIHRKSFAPLKELC